MFDTKVKLQYKAFGFSVHSDMLLPELSAAESDTAKADITVKVNSFLKNGFDAEPYDFIAEDGMVSVKMPDAGVFRVQDGDKIIVSPYAGADEDLIRLYVLGTCFGILLLQRGIYPLHGSALAINGKAYAIVGQSGAGKSTLASALIEKGFRLLSDDVIAVSHDSLTGQPIVAPSYPQQKLWQNSLEAMGQSHEALRSIFGRETKYCVPLTDSFHGTSLPLGGVFELTRTTELDGIELEPAGKLERLPLLFRHTYRYQLIERMNLMKWHFEQSAALASRLNIYRLRRGESAFTAPQLADLILNTISTEGTDHGL
ncbi:aldolase [Paenibacillus paeoniae]|uniref:aldolase n=1 Tax=Paenibacillus paeoniae TaxID=2292705 RepID=UPI001F0C7F21|nr:aldolase [Paenibacillus paeoniae]